MHCNQLGRVNSHNKIGEIMKPFNLSPGELFQALFDHGVSVEYSRQTDNLHICPLAGEYAGKCLLPSGMTEVSQATLIACNDEWRVEGVLGSSSGANSEGFKEFQLAPHHIPIELSNNVFLVRFRDGAKPYQQGSEVLIVKNQIYLIGETNL